MFKKKGHKYRYKLTFVSGTGLPDGAFACLSWKRGSKAENQGETKQKLVFDGKAEWNESITVLCTLFPDGNKYDEKSIVLTVNEFNVKKKKLSPIGLTKLNLSDYAHLHGASQTEALVIKPAKKKAGAANITLNVTIHTELAQSDVDASETDMGGAEVDPEDEDPFAKADAAASSGASEEGSQPLSDDESTPAPPSSAVAAASEPAASVSEPAEEKKKHREKDKDKDKDKEKRKKKEDKEEGSSSSSKAELTEAKKELETVKGELSRAREIESEQQLELRRLREERDRATKVIEDCQRDVEDAQRQLSAVKGGDSSLRTELERANSELSRLREEQGALVADSTKAKSEAETKGRRVAEMEEELTLVKRQLSAVKGGDSALKGEVDKLRDELVQVKERGARLENELKRAREDLEKERKKNDELDEEIMFLKRKLKDFEEVPASKPSTSGASSVSTSGTSPDIDKLKQQISSLSKDLDESRSEARASSKKAKELEAQLEQQRAKSVASEATTSRDRAASGVLQAAKEKSSSSSAMAAVAAAEQHAAELEEELRQTKKAFKAGKERVSLLSSLLEASLSQEYDQANGRPETAAIISTHLKEIVEEGGDVETEEGEPSPASAMLAEIVTAAKKAKSLSQMMHWLSTAWWLVRDLSGEEDGENMLVTKPLQDEEERGLRPEAKVFLYEMFMGALSKAIKSLSSVLVQSFVDKSSSSSTTQQRGGRYSPAAVISVLNELNAAMKESHMNEGVRKQFFSQVVFAINATLFNQLVTKQELCTCGTALQIKLGLSQVEEWLSRDTVVYPSRKFLEHIKEASNLLAMDKTILKDEQTTKSTFPSLNVKQVLQLVQAFQPDDYTKERVAPDVVRAIKDRSAQSQWELPIEIDPDQFLDPQQPSLSSPIQTPSITISNTTNQQR